MKFWQLVSIFRDKPKTLEDLLNDPRWSNYRLWLNDLGSYIDSQNRTILDSVIPEALAVSAMQLCQIQFQIRDGTLYKCPENSEAALNAVDVHRLFGGQAIEEVLEKGSCPICALPK